LRYTKEPKEVTKIVLKEKKEKKSLKTTAGGEP
jgi:hypothetical protein